MAAKSLRHAIITALTEKNVYLSEEQTVRLENELRDFMAHEIMKIEKDGIATAQSLFDRIFRKGAI